MPICNFVQSFTSRVCCVDVYFKELHLVDKGVNNTFLSMHENESFEKELVLLESLCRPKRIVLSKWGLTKGSQLLSRSLNVILPQNTCSPVIVSGVSNFWGAAEMLPCHARLMKGCAACVGHVQPGLPGQQGGASHSR